MPDSPLLAGWTNCPRCGHELDREERAVRCASCGLSTYATPAPTASAILVDERGRVLLARRMNDPGAGLWDLLGGFIEEGEEALAALHREIEEETGLEIEPLGFLGAYPDRYGDEGIYTLNLYWTARITGGELALEADELAEVAWFAPDELPEGHEFAFANTVEALTEWRSAGRSAAGEK
jgi:8-oxo-dGTP diphosphatase